MSEGLKTIGDVEAEVEAPTSLVPFLSECVSLPFAIRRGAHERPGHPYIREVGGTDVTFVDADERARRWAAAFESIGVEPGDSVACLLPPSAERVLVWAGVAWVRALDVGVNTDYVGRMLHYVLTQSRSKVLVVGAEYLDRVREIADDLGSLQAVVVVGHLTDDVALPFPVYLAETLVSAVDPVPADRELPGPCDVYGLIYTSGTTGSSKGVLVTWRQLWMFHHGGLPMDALGADDVWYAPFPMYHVSGQSLVLAAANRRGTVVVRHRFSASEYWSDIATYGCTATMLIGAMISMLQAAEPTELEHKHRTVNCVGAPLPKDIPAFERRFNMDMWVAFAMTEISSAITTPLHPVDPASCGSVRPAYHVRLVDDEGRDVPNGVPGELLVRCDIPAVISPGYFGMEDATQEAWRDGWFATGDLLARDEHGNYRFVDRKKDAMRRRGENVSSVEVETIVNEHPGILECAAVGVPSPHTEDDIKIVVLAKPGAALDPREVCEWLEPRMPRFMLPRFVEIVDELPKTPTGKVRKVELRTAIRGVVWDREADVTAG